MNATEWRTGVCLFLGLDDEIPVPQQCLSCGKPNSVAHGLTCKTGKAIFLRHEEAKDEIVACLQDAGYYVISAKNPHLEGDASVDGELFSDIKVRGLYYRQRYAHLDITTPPPIADWGKTQSRRWRRRSRGRPRSTPRPHRARGRTLPQ